MDKLTDQAIKKKKIVAAWGQGTKPPEAAALWSVKIVIEALLEHVFCC